MDAAIEVANVSCRNARRAEVVRDLTFAVRPGSIFALLGPNGAGKTTTIRVLMNMIRPARGVASVLGIETTRRGPRERAQTGYVSENQKLPLWMTVAHFLVYLPTVRRFTDGGGPDDSRLRNSGSVGSDRLRVPEPPSGSVAVRCRIGTARVDCPRTSVCRARLRSRV